MSLFYFFSDEQLRKLKPNDLLKLAEYYHVNYDKKKPKIEHIIADILKEQKIQSFLYASGISEPEPTGVSVRIQRIRDQNRQEQ